MNDSEILCTFMGWHKDTFDGVPPAGHLHLLWEVEERLIQRDIAGYRRYEDKLIHSSLSIHATPEQKIKALAEVLKPLVERGDRP